MKGPRVGRYLIYGLMDPRDRCLCYVGKTHKRRELRLAEHIERALDGSTAPVHQWIRELTVLGLSPEVFVLERVPPDLEWGEAERRLIKQWRDWPNEKLPYVHPPQTPKSVEVTIGRVDLRNIRNGG